jgi:hypothetical protein
MTMTDDDSASALTHYSQIDALPWGEVPGGEEALAFVIVAIAAGAMKTWSRLGELEALGRAGFLELPGATEEIARVVEAVLLRARRIGPDASVLPASEITLDTPTDWLPWALLGWDALRVRMRVRFWATVGVLESIGVAYLRERLTDDEMRILSAALALADREFGVIRLGGLVGIARDSAVIDDAPLAALPWRMYGAPGTRLMFLLANADESRTVGWLRALSDDELLQLEVSGDRLATVENVLASAGLARAQSTSELCTQLSPATMEA